ncbi:MAG: hypothetical protein Q9173_004837 [Seirophora scorigena]
MNKQKTQDAGNQSHPWTDFQGRPFWSAQKPSRTWMKRLRQRTAKTQGRNERGIRRRLYFGKTTQGENQMRVIVRGNGFASSQEITAESPLSIPDSRCPDSPVELATIEHGSYEEVRELLSASARKLALEMRQAQTLQQLERMQDEEPEMLRICRPVDLDSSTSPLAELPGSTIDITTLLRHSRSRHESRLGPPGLIEDSRRHSWSGLEVVPTTAIQAEKQVVDLGNMTHSPTQNPHNPCAKFRVGNGRSGEEETTPEKANRILSLGDSEVNRSDQQKHGRNEEGSGDKFTGSTHATDHEKESRSARCTCKPTSVCHQRSVSVPFVSQVQGEQPTSPSAFTDLDLLIRVLPPRKSPGRNH